MNKNMRSSTLVEPSYRAWIKPPYIAPFYFSLGSYQVHGEVNRDTFDCAFELRLRIGNMKNSGNVAVGSGNLRTGVEPLVWDAKIGTGSLRLYVQGEDELWIQIASESKSHGFIAADDVGAANGSFRIGNIEPEFEFED